MCTLSLLLSLLLAQGTASVEDELRRAKNEYSYGQYGKAIEHLESLLYPMRLYSDEQVIEARVHLALAHYLQGNAEQVRSEFTKLLYLSPDYELDPFTVAPPIIELFENVRRGLQPELDVIRRRRNEKLLEKPQREGFIRVIERSYVEKSDVATFLPFAVGQFQNGDVGAGIGFALSQIVLLGLNVGSFLWAHKLGDFRTDQASLHRTLVMTQYASAAMFGVVWSASVFHARLNFVPQVVNPAVIREEPFASREARPLRLGAVLGLTGQF
ncbi:MAG: hypothetical protein R3C68_19990 [Myxococcota bacterium]